MTEIKIYQEVELSLTENLVPTVVHVKQFDHLSRKIRCVLYSHSVEYQIPEGASASCAGTRPDGHLFQYSSETAPELVAVEDNAVIFTVTGFMTEVSGRFPVDVILLDGGDEALGVFSLTLQVERAAVGNGKIAVLTYNKALDAIAAGIYACFITEDGHFGIQSEDGLGLTPGSVSSTLDQVNEKLLACSVTEDGYIAFETEDRLGLVFDTDEEGRLVVLYGEA